jgi:hypothetical protein
MCNIVLPSTFLQHNGHGKTNAYIKKIQIKHHRVIVEKRSQFKYKEISGSNPKQFNSQKTLKYIIKISLIFDSSKYNQKNKYKILIIKHIVFYILVY